MSRVGKRWVTGFSRERWAVMDRRHFLAAELFAYSFANYQGHLEVGNLRFTRHMPAEVEILERAEAEEWPAEMIASKLNVPVGEIPDLRVRFAQAKAVVDAPSPAEAFRRGVRQSIRDAVDNGLDSVVVHPKPDFSDARGGDSLA